MMRLTPVVKNLVIINVIIFLVWLFASAIPGLEALMNAYFVLYKTGPVFVRPIYYGGNHFLPVQIVTSFFSHSGILHIAFNMLALASLGPAIESAIGGKRFLSFYLFTGVVAGVLLAILDPSHNPVLGASTAIFGVIAAFAYIYPRAPLSFFFLPPFEAKKFAIGAAVISAVLVLSELRGFGNAGGISHFGHLMGMVAAVIYFYAEKYLPFLPK
ncbi:MAG: rhomboid family intramembrane serine protease [Bacteroidota bacterium]